MCHKAFNTGCADNSRSTCNNGADKGFLAASIVIFILLKLTLVLVVSNRKIIKLCISFREGQSVVVLNNGHLIFKKIQHCFGVVNCLLVWSKCSSNALVYGFQ